MVPEDVDGTLGMVAAPAAQIACKAVVDHVSEDEIPVRRNAAEGFAAQQRGDDTDVVASVGLVGPEREGQQFRTSAGRQSGMKPQQPPLDAGVTGEGIARVVEQKLVGDARHRNVDPEAADGQAGEQFVEVHDPVGA